MMNTELKEIALRMAVDLALSNGLDAAETVSAADTFYGFLTDPIAPNEVKVEIHGEHIPKEVLASLMRNAWDLGFEGGEAYANSPRRGTS